VDFCSNSHFYHHVEQFVWWLARPMWLRGMNISHLQLTRLLALNCRRRCASSKYRRRVHSPQREMSWWLAYLFTFLKFCMYTLASVALNFTQGAGTSCVACIALRALRQAGNRLLLAIKHATISFFRLKH